MIQRRRGFTLIELLVVVTLSSIVLTIAARTVFVMLRAQANAGESVVDAASFATLSQLFRDDAHAATSSEITSGNGVLTEIAFSFDANRRATYAVVEKGRLVRTVLERSRPVRRDPFRFERIGFRFESSQQDRLAAIVCDSSSPIRVVGVVGRDRRWNRERPSTGRTPRTP